MDLAAADLLHRGLRASTHRSYNSAQRHYLKFCDSYNLTPTPADETQLLRYITFCHESNLSFNTIKVYLSAVASLHTYLGLDRPPSNSFRLKLALKAISDNSPLPNQKSPITLQILSNLLALLSCTYDDMLLKAILSFGFFLGLRGSEYTSTPDNLNYPKISQIKFILDHDCITGIEYSIPVTKTRPHGLLVSLGCSNIPTCGLCLMYDYLSFRSKLFGLNPDDLIICIEFWDTCI